MGGFAWVTLATNDSYSLGALVLANSLRRAGTPHDLVALITPGVTDVMREKLSTVFTLVQEVNILDSKDEANLRLLARPELGITFTKLHCWRLTQYEKCVFVDADALVIRNCDELFQREELSAAPDVGWPDCFNSGVFVFKPSQETYDSLVAFATEKGSFDGGDQGLLNTYFSDWAQKDISKHLPFIYNMCSTATYSYLPAFKQFGEDVRIIHFIGATKPWLQYFDTLTGIVQPPSGSNHLQPLLQVWWNIFCDNVHPELNPVMATSTLAPPGQNNFSFSQISRIGWTLSYDSNNETHSDFGLQEVDFSEFKHPWESYSSRLDPFLKDIQQITQEYPDNSESGSSFQKFEEVDRCQQPNQTQEFNDKFEEEPQFWNYGDNEIKEYHPEQQESKDFSQNEIHQAEFQNEEEYQKDCYLINEHHDQQSSLEECQIHQVLHSALKKVHHTSQNFQSKLKEEKPSHSHFHSHPNSSVSISHDQKPHTKLYQTSDRNLKSFNQSRKVRPKGILKNTADTDKAALQKRLDREQDLKQSRQNDEQTKLHRLRSQFPSKTHIIPKVASRSEQRMKHPESTEAGLAGALAKLTLGEPRSNEQFAFEEHMRKQSWEQGQIDYLGRDSFDNIWKKISETLSTAAVREKTPPQTDEKELKKEVTEASIVEETEKTENTESQKTGTKTSDVATGTDTPTADPVQEVTKIPTALEVQKVSEPVSETPVIPEEIKPTKVVFEPVLEIPAVPEEIESGPLVAEPVPESPVAEDIKPAPVTKAVQPTQVAEAAQPVPVVPEPVPEIPVVFEEIKAPVVLEVLQTPVVPKKVILAPVLEQNQPTSVSESTTTPEQTQQTPAVEPDPTKPIIEQLQKAEEAEEVQETPVPIQVAESVLQAELKESVSQVTLPVEEEAISSIVTSVQESALAVSEALIDPATATPTITESATPKLENGSVDPETEILSLPTISRASGTSESSTALLVRSTNVVSLNPDPKESDVPKETEVPKEVEVPKETDVLKETEVPKEIEVLKQSEVLKEIEVLKETEIPKEAEVQEPKLERRTSSSMEKPLVPVSEPKLTVQIPQRQPSEISGSVEKSEQQKESEASSEGSPQKTSESLESPSRPIRSKELKTPATPTVTEATPPTSPPIDPEEGESEPKVAKKVVKKIVKKQSTEESEEAEGESSGKKVTKKVVKKVIKKKEGDAEGSSSTEKKKVVKKTTTTKSAQLEAEKSVPETPPPESTEGPVPPKRKLKTSTTTKETAAKKPDTEL